MIGGLLFGIWVTLLFVVNELYKIRESLEKGREE